MAIRMTPVPVMGISNATMVTAGDAFACAHRTSNEVYCWGANSSGQLGDGTMMLRSAPVGEVPSARSVAAEAP